LMIENVRSIAIRSSFVTEAVKETCRLIAFTNHRSKLRWVNRCYWSGPVRGCEKGNPGLAKGRGAFV
jgi:hypothetical protein